MTLKKSARFAFLGILFIFYSCSGNKGEVQSFGQLVDSTKAFDSKQLAAKIGVNQGIKVTISGKVNDVCKAEGCWIKMDQNGSEQMVIRMKGRAFTLPEEIQGKYAFASGIAHYDTISVEKQKENATNNGLNDSLIALIVSPKVELVFEADGVMFR